MSKLTDGVSNRHSVRLLDRLGAGKLHCGLNFRYQRERGGAGKLCAVHLVDDTHKTFWLLGGHCHIQAFVWSNDLLLGFWK